MKFISDLQMLKGEPENRNNINYDNKIIIVI